MSSDLQWWRPGNEPLAINVQFIFAAVAKRRDRWISGADPTIWDRVE
jgi:hypothetical protein